MQRIHKIFTGRKNVFRLCIGLLLLFTASCKRMLTVTSYRENPKSEYLKACGYIVACECNIQRVDTHPNIVVSVFTPLTWGEFYYEYLKGQPCADSVIVKQVTVSFNGFVDTLSLVRRDKQNNFYFTAPNLKEQINANRQLQVKIIFENGAGEKILLLKRHRYRYLTGGRGIGGC